MGQRPRPPAPPLDPDPSATWWEVAAKVHALLPRLTDVWWATLPGGKGVGHNLLVQFSTLYSSKM